MKNCFRRLRNGKIWNQSKYLQNCVLKHKLIISCFAKTGFHGHLDVYVGGMYAEIPNFGL